MKFRKLLVGLMGFPFLLTSCSNALTFDQAKKWIEENYPKETKEVRAIPCISWDFSATNGDKAVSKVHEILLELHENAEDEKLQPYVIPTYEDMPAIGQTRLIPYYDVENPERSRPTQMMEPLIASKFDKFSDKAEDDVYKINNGCFNVTYKKAIKCFGKDDKGEYTTYSTSVRVFNAEGYCTDYGYKANKYMDKDNTLKFKFLIHFEYENDPF